VSQQPHPLNFTQQQPAKKKLIPRPIETTRVLKPSKLELGLHNRQGGNKKGLSPSPTQSDATTSTVVTMVLPTVAVDTTSLASPAAATATSSTTTTTNSAATVSASKLVSDDSVGVETDDVLLRLKEAEKASFVTFCI
jgi:hypothetical protein